jgi:hypothetical protein
MDASVINDGLPSKESSDIDVSTHLDTTPFPEEQRSSLSSQGHVLVSQDIEKEAFQEKIGRQTRDILCQEIRSFLERPITYVIKKACTKERLPFILIMSLATFLRFYQFPSLPIGLNQDEASAGYETYALLLHGTDRWGNKFPVYFPSWGSGQNVLLSYLNIPFIKVFGLTVLGERLSSALLGVLTIVVLYGFVKRWYGTKAALIATFLLGTNPWHIMLSRWSLESNLLPCFFLFGIACLSYCSTSQYARILKPFSLLLLSLSFYAYGVAAVIIPIFLVIYFLLIGLQWFMERVSHCSERTHTRYMTSILHAITSGISWQNVLGILLSFVIFFLVSLPFFLFILDNFILHSTPAFVQHLPFRVPLLIETRLAQLSGRQSPFASNFQFLLSGFNDGLIWNIANPYLPLGLLSFPLMILGIYYSMKTRQVHANLFSIWLIATIPIFFLYYLNINRANALYLPVIALSAIGISGLSDSIDKKRTKLEVVSLLLASIALYNGLFCWYYFRDYNDQIKDTFNAGFDVALAQAKSSATPNEPIYISNRVNGSYVLTLFFLKADPLDFQKHSTVFISNGSYQVINYRNYYFYPNNPEILSAPSFIAILKDGEQLSCSQTQTFYSDERWTVERCFN